MLPYIPKTSRLASSSSTRSEFPEGRWLPEPLPRLISQGILQKRQAWQNLIETQFNLMRRLADWDFAQDASWNQMLATHGKWIADHNYQPHYAHKDRQDGRYSPAEVLGWVRGQTQTPEELHRIFYETRFLRHLDKVGYLRFRHWRIYGEYGLSRHQVVIWLYEEHLTVEFADQPLAQYQVNYQSNKKEFRQITPMRLFETSYQSPQLPLWEPGEVEWHQVIRAVPSVSRKRGRATIAMVQQPLFP